MDIIDLCMSFVYPGTLLLFENRITYYLWFSRYTIISSANREFFTSYLTDRSLLGLFYLIALDNTSGTVLNNGRKSKNSSLSLSYVVCI